MAGLHTPLSTLHVRPHGRPRMTRGRCGSLLLHRNGLAPPTPCRSPGAPDPGRSDASPVTQTLNLSLALLLGGWTFTDGNHDMRVWRAFPHDVGAATVGVSGDPLQLRRVRHDDHNVRSLDHPLVRSGLGFGIGISITRAGVA